MTMSIKRSLLILGSVMLTGGALLSVGSWLFMIGAFAAAYLVAPLVKRACV